MDGAWLGRFRAITMQIAEKLPLEKRSLPVVVDAAPTPDDRRRIVEGRGTRIESGALPLSSRIPVAGSHERYQRPRTL